MENNKGIPHDRPLFLSSAGHKSSDLLLEHPPPASSSSLLYHNQTAEVSSGDLINKLQTDRKSEGLGKGKKQTGYNQCGFWGGGGGFCGSIHH